jgi:hypothetical protein
MLLLGVGACGSGDAHAVETSSESANATSSTTAPPASTGSDSGGTSAECEMEMVGGSGGEAPCLPRDAGVDLTFALFTGDPTPPGDQWQIQGEASCTVHGLAADAACSRTSIVLRCDYDDGVREQQLVVDTKPGTELDVELDATVTFQYRIWSAFECCTSVVFSVADADGPIIAGVDLDGAFTSAQTDALVAEAFAAFDGRRVGPACAGPNDGHAYSLELSIAGETVTVSDDEVVDASGHRVLVDLARVFEPPDGATAGFFRAAVVRTPAQ